MHQSGIEPWLATAAKQRVGDFVRDLRTVSDTSLPVPNLAWTVADLAQHVACLGSYWQKHHDAGPDYERPADFAANSDRARAHITETDAAKLAELIEHELSDYIASAVEGPEDLWLYGLKNSASDMLALLLSETVMHGRDLARVTGSTPPMLGQAEAHAVVDAFMVTTPFFVDAEKARAQPDGVYHVAFRGGKDYTWTKQGDKLTVTEGRPQRADARLKTDPGMFVLSSLGRVGQIRAAMSGKMVSYGRKPWRFLGLGKIVADGI